MHAYSYNQWNTSGQSSGNNAPAVGGSYAPVNASYQAAAEPLNTNQPYYQSTNTKYGGASQAPSAGYGTGGAPPPPPNPSGSQGMAASGYHSGLFSLSSSASSYQSKPAYDAGPQMPPAPIGTKPVPPRGPFEAVSRAPPSSTPQGPSSNFGSHSLPSGGPRFKSRVHQIEEHAAPILRSRAPRPLMGMSGDWGEAPRRWDRGGPPGRWDGPPSRWEELYANRWDELRGRFDKWDEPRGKRGRWQQDGPMRGQRPGRGGGFSDGARHVGKPSLMSLDFDRRKDNQSRKRRLSDSAPAIHSKRHVDEDLNVTIATGRGIDDKERHYCIICNVKIKKGYELQQHLRGRKHKQRAAEQKAAGVDSAQNSGQAADADISMADTLTLLPLDDPEKLRFYCVICRLSLLTEINKQAHDCTPSHLKRVQEIEDLEKNKEDEMKVCEMCVTTYKACEEEAHKQSEGHQEARHWRMASCEICTCKFNDTVELKKHLLLPKHQKQMEKLNQHGLTAEKMTIYFENVQAAIQEKRLSFCLICTTACGNVENLEIHNAVESKFHNKMNREASKAEENQFYCFCCKKLIEETERRAHGKSMRHKQSKDMHRSWECADCNISFDEERKLYPHLKCRAHATQVERRKAIQRYAADKCMQEWRMKQIEANKIVEGKLAEQTAEGAEVKDEKEEAEQDLPFDADVKVMPITGHYCLTCKTFYQFDAGRKNLCVHVKRFKGIKDKKGSELADAEGDAPGSSCDDDANGEKVEEASVEGECDHYIKEESEGLCEEQQQETVATPDEETAVVEESHAGEEQQVAGGDDEMVDGGNEPISGKEQVGGEDNSEQQPWEDNSREHVGEGDPAINEPIAGHDSFISMDEEDVDVESAANEEAGVSSSS